MHMASSTKQRTTMAKLARERALRERREIKQAKKDARKRAAAAPAIDANQTAAPAPPTELA
jgi:hypothetical protein